MHIMRFKTFDNMKIQNAQYNNYVNYDDTEWKFKLNSSVTFDLLAFSLC